jgi:competence protein ComEC
MRGVVPRCLLSLLVCALAACPAPRPPPVHPLEPGGGTGNITWTHASTAAEIPHTPPAPGTYRLHLIDVGTGLAILVQGADFAMMYDAGTNDREEKPSRVAAYLAAALGPSGDDLCGPEAPGKRLTIENVVLSHPHFDHASALDLVLHCYEVHHFWDSGRINATVFYRELLAAIGKATGLTYHTAADVPADHEVTVKDTTIHISTWERFSEGDVVKLGEGAQFTILHAEPKALKDPNQNSVVIILQLGSTHVLLVGDAESGERRDPSYPVGDVEEFLIDHHKAEIRADILQVGHHGSKTSSRRDFLAAVHPSLALVSSGPKQYGKTVLPDHEVLDELKAQGATILRTDEHDDGCPESGKIGGDAGPGGCDSWVISIGAGQRLGAGR